MVLAIIACLGIGLSATAADDTRMTMDGDPNEAICPGEAVTLTISVSNDNTDSETSNGWPQGTVSFSSDGPGSFNASICTLVADGTYESTCSGVPIKYTPASADGSPHTITAVYTPLDARWATSQVTWKVYVNACVEVLVIGSETPLIVNDWTWITATVVDVSGVGPIPTGTVSFSKVNSGDDGTFFDGSSESLEGGQCRVKYRADSVETGGVHEIKAHYSGNYDTTDGYYDQAIEPREADIQIEAVPSAAYVHQPVMLTVRVRDDTTEGDPPDLSGLEVTLSSDDDGGWFEGEDPGDDYVETLDSTGVFQVEYTPGPLDSGETIDTIEISAAFTGSSIYSDAEGTTQITAELRPTQTTAEFGNTELLVNEATSLTVKVIDLAGTGSAPAGTIDLSTSEGSTDLSLAAIGGYPILDDGDGETEWLYSYARTEIHPPNQEEGIVYDVVTCEYDPDDGIHLGSEGKYGVSVSRRPVEITLGTCNCYPSAADCENATGFQIVASVAEHPDCDGHGDSVSFDGKLYYVGEDGSDVFVSNVTGNPPGDITVVMETDLPIAVPIIKFIPNGGVHLQTTVSPDQPCKRDIEPPPGDGSTGANCTDGCGTGGTDIDQMIFDMNAAAIALHATQMGLDAAATIASIFPEALWGAGIGFISGSTIPIKDLVIAGIEAVNQLLEIAVVALETDLDGDGLPDVVEETVTGTSHDEVDSDQDGLGDYDEISEAGGFYGGSRRPDPNVWDSDGDGLGDGDEVGFNTSFCVQDTDCDGLTDYQEITTAYAYDSDTVGSSTPDADSREHCDPLAPDTDGDGIWDNVEYFMGGSCPFPNDDDSDDDGVQDGHEDANLDGCWGTHSGDTLPWTCIGGITVGNSTSQASKTIALWETDLCNPDTDGDGLLDGEEEGLFGVGELTPEGVSVTVGVSGPNLGVTVGALDSDMDNDGLTDYEEVNLYQTDPTDADTDNDTVSDGAEIATWDSTIAARLGTTASADSRDHANPRMDDTDGDGITDDLEIAYGCNCGTGTDGYVNDDDSDDDGLQDGREYELSGTGADIAAASGNDGELNDDAICCLCDPDSDGDGLSDGEEVHTGTDPLDWDSDDDGLSDREELQTYFTDPNNADTDGDGAVLEYGADCTLTDRPMSVPLAGYAGTTASKDITVSRYELDGNTPVYTPETQSVEYYVGVTLGSDGIESVSREGVYPFDHLGDQSDPLQKDTDGDGIQDDIEFKPGCNCSGTGIQSGRDGFVNDDDSDNDGLQDGAEYDRFGSDDVGEAGAPPVLGNDGELHDDPVCSLCDPDSDGDGLLDGEEAYIGTDPLDWDSDDDGLSDREELQTYFTDPNDDDTDDDQADGNVAARDPATSPILSGYTGTAAIDALSDCEEALSGTTHPPFGDALDQTDPLQDDTDGDGLGDAVEFKVMCSCETNEWVTCPNGSWTYASPNHYGVVYDPMLDGYANSFDSDGDGLRDDLDIAADVAESNGNDGELNDDTTHSICDPDSDGDGLSDGEEYHVGTDRLDWDSDDDGLSDREELQTYFTDPNDDDTDDDRAEGNMADRDPAIAPLLPGHSGNGSIQALSDCEEAFSGTSYSPYGNPLDETDPLQLDTDGDGLGDEIEFKVGCSCATTDWCDCPTNPVGWTYADPNHYGVVYDPIRDGYANSSDSDEDGLRDGEDIHEDLVASAIDFPGKVFTRRAMFSYPDEVTLREQRDDTMHSICDPDSDGDGLLDGEEFAIGTEWLDWDTDDDGRNDWHEHTGGEQVTTGDPVPSDPFDPDTDDDGLLDSAEVFGTNNTNVLNADTDGDGLCDGGTGTPYMMDWFNGDTTVHVNPICKSCAEPSLDPCAASVRTGSVDGIGDHPNPHGYGEDKNGNGAWEPGGYDYWGDVYAGDETDPNQYDTDGDADGDGIEVLGFSTSRQGWIPTVDLFDRPINVTYPECGCLNPLDPDTDDDQLEDGYEDRNHDGNFDFLPSEFDHYDPLPGPPIPYPTETNPCDADTDDDELTDYEERYQAQVFEFYANWDNDGDGLYNEDPFEDGIDEDGDGLDGEDPVEPPFNPTNPLDHDTDNDWILDGPEVFWECVELEYFTLDNDTDGFTDEDPLDGEDNDGDGLIDEDPQDYWIRFVPMLDPTNRDSDSDGWIDGLDEDPCNSELIPLVAPVQLDPIDTDGDGFSDDDEILAETHPNDPEDHPIAYGMMNLDQDCCFDDRLWLEPRMCCGIANSVVIDIDSNILADMRVQIRQPRDVRMLDLDGDGYEDDAQYTIEYAFALYRVVQRRIVLTIDDYDTDFVIDHVGLETK